MEITSAIALVNNLIYKPGWQFIATDHSDRFEGSIKVRIDYPARNSNRDQAMTGYPEEIATYASFPVIVRDLDDSGLYREIMDAIICIESHEAREFLRVSLTGWAPFHPHRIDGMKRWNSTAVVSGEFHLDLTFGIA